MAGLAIQAGKMYGARHRRSSYAGGQHRIKDLTSGVGTPRDGRGKEGKVREKEDLWGFVAASHIVTWTCEQIGIGYVGELSDTSCIPDRASRAREYKFMHAADRSDLLEPYIQLTG